MLVPVLAAMAAMVVAAATAVVALLVGWVWSGGGGLWQCLCGGGWGSGCGGVGCCGVGCGDGAAAARPLPPDNDKLQIN